MADFEIRPLNDRDSLEALTELLHQAYASMAVQGFNMTAADQSVETTRERCEGGMCLVAELDGRLIGTIKLNPPDPESLAIEFHEPEIGIINQFGVRTDFRGRGVGRALHEAAEVEAQRLGCSALLLDTVEAAADLVALYESWGYDTVGQVQWPGKSYRSLIMRKSLRPKP